MKLAKLTIQINKMEGYEEQLADWLHEKAEELKELDKNEYAKKANWSFIINE